MKKIISFTPVLLVLCGIIMIVAGTGGIAFTYQNVAREDITTADDASIPEKPVRGPFTLLSQADVIRHHTLDRTDNKTFAQMPRQIPKVDESGNPVLDDKGEPVMTSNTARDGWYNATTLMTALHLGVLTYGFCAFVICVGVLSLLNGFALRTVLAKN